MSTVVRDADVGWVAEGFSSLADLVSYNLVESRSGGTKPHYELDYGRRASLLSGANFKTVLVFTKVERTNQSIFRKQTEPTNPELKSNSFFTQD